MFNLEILRELARSPKWQSLYAHVKQMGNLRLFDNNFDLTPIQLNFLHWLEINEFLEKELVRESKYLNRDIIKDNIRVDAYLLMRKRTKNSDKDKKEVDNNSGLPSVSFRRKKK